MSTDPAGDVGSLRIGVDIGGTFTDIIAFDPRAGTTESIKVPSTPDSPADGIVNGLETLFDRTEYVPADVGVLSHGSTVTINAVIERTGAETGLLVTEGFDAILIAGRGDRPQAEVKNPRYIPPEPLIPQRLIRDIPERIDADGGVSQPLDEAAAREAVADLRDRGVESIAVCFLFSFLNPDHELRVAEIIEEVHPECAVSCSSDVVPRIREYPRLSTTAVNAYVDPMLGSYLAELESALQDRAIAPHDRSMMLSHGGLDTFERAAAKPVQTLMSGPAAGVEGARFVAELADQEDIVTLDMGGTSCDIATVPALDPLTTTEKEFDWNPVSVPMIDVESIGAGGGTIARVVGGRLQIGPESAGANPGPVCYGRGGEAVTITDANVALGRLNPDGLLGGDLALDVEAARTAIESTIADPLGLSVDEGAAGVIEVVNDKMKKELSLAFARRGFDPRRFSLVTYGGAGPMHGPSIARQLSIDRVIVPPWPGINSAVGLLASDHRRLYQRSRIDRLEDAPLSAVFESLEATALEEVTDRVPDDAVAIDRELELRYEGQSYELLIDIEPGDDSDAIRRQFDTTHDATYGHTSDEPVETMTYRVTVGIDTPTITGDLLRRPRPDDPTAEPFEQRSVYLGGQWQETPIYRRRDLQPGTELQGPALIEQLDTTVFVESEVAASVDEYGIIELSGFQ